MTRSGDITIRVTSAIGSALLLALAGCMNNPQTASMTGAPAKNVCIQTYQIDHTEIPDDSTILFHMTGGKVWKNTLTAPCPGLRSNGGFKYATDINEICSNLQSIRVIEQVGGPRLGAVCLLGEFTPYTPPPKANAGQ